MRKQCDHSGIFVPDRSIKTDTPSCRDDWRDHSGSMTPERTVNEVLQAAKRCVTTEILVLELVTRNNVLKPVFNSLSEHFNSFLNFLK